MKVYIAQLKCPQNHCVLGMAGEFESEADAAVLAYQLGAKMGALVQAKTLKHECGICLSTNLHVTIDPTIFNSMADAAPILRESERLQAMTAAILKAMRN